MAEPVRVAYFINSLEQGGAERQLVELIRALDPTRFEPHLIVCKDQDQIGLELRHGSVTSLDAPLFPTPISAAQLSAALMRIRPHILHTYMGWENIVGRLAARASGVPRVVGSVRSTRLPRTQIVAESLTRGAVDAIIVNSVGIRDELVSRARLDAATINVVENGVDLVRFRPADPQRRGELRRRFDVEGRRLIVVPGRVSAEKNQLSILRAMAAMRRRGTLGPEVLLVLAGRSSLITYGNLVRASIAVAGLREQVRALGVVRNIEDLLAAADAVLLPSHFEGLPNAVIEAMACGVPAIVSPAANNDALIRDGVEGVVTGGTGPEAICASLERFLALDEAARRAMGEAGVVHARRRFSVQRMAASTVAVYERLHPRR